MAEQRARVFVSWRFPDPALPLLEATLDVQLWEGDTPMPRTDFLRVIADVAGVLVSNATERLDREAMDAAPRLKVISNFGVGVDNVDLSLATERGILVCNTPGVLVETTADHAFALLLAVARRLPEAQQHVRADRWQGWHPKLLVGQEIYGATLGIVGLGAIGSAVARRAKGFNMRVVYASRTRRPELEESLGVQWSSLDDLLQQADYVCLTTALTAETRGLIGQRELALMKPSAVLVNIARGPIVDQSALYDALKEHLLFGAGLDVTDPEPMRGTDPLLTLDNCLIVPHIGSAGAGARARMSELAANNLIDGLAGRRPKHLVNPEARNLSS
ncbi:MAG TPA: D-glycerate dehydrogenase [Chloroflexota bacterium]|jgi:glyoxylate reductase